MRKTALASPWILLAATAGAAELPRYDMDVTLTPESSGIRVVGSVVLPPATAQRTTLEFSLMNIMTELKVESSPPSALTAAAEALPGAGNLERRLTFATPVAAGDEVTIRFSYSSQTPSKFVYHIGTDAMLAGGPTSAWFPKLVSKAKGTIRYHYPRRYTMVAGGPAVDEIAGNTRTTTVTYAKPATFSFVAAEFIQHERQGVVPMRAFVLHDRQGLDAYLDGCSRILALLTQEFGPYPFDGFVLVEAPGSATQPAGFSGASFEGYMVASSDDLDQPFNLAYFGHEIGHQWWGNLVTRKGDAGGQLMSEGLAQYGSLRAVEEIDGPAAAERYRTRGYPAYNRDQCGLGYLRYAAAGFDAPLSVPTKGYLPFMHQLADSKGFLALDHLSRVAGREQFRDALREITSRFAFASISWEELKAIVQSHAGRDLSRTYSEWFERTGAPSWSVDWKQIGHSVEGAIVQPDQPYTLDVDVVFAGGDRSETHRVAIGGARTSFSIAIPFTVEQVDIDPHFTVLHWTPEYRAEANAVVDFTRGWEKLGEGDDAGAGALFAAALPRVPAIDRHGLRFLLEIGSAYSLENRKKDEEAERHLISALAAPVRPPDLLPNAYGLLARMADRKHDLEKLALYANAAATAERTTGVVTGAAASAAALLRANGLPLP